jgi:cytochrome c
MKMLLILIAMLGLAQAQDVAHGKIVFWKCSYCHGLDGTGGFVGPPLKGVIGRTSGTVPSYLPYYSDTMKEVGIVWDENSLPGFLGDPNSMIQGTRMRFDGIKDQKDIQDLIAYLKTLK